jgi:large subunit ribosomal protein L14
MIQVGSMLNVIDNSGARKVQCLKVIGGNKRRYAYIGDTILISVKKLRAKRRVFSRVRKGEMHRAVVVRTKAKSLNRNSDNFWSLQNSAILISKQDKLIGTRIFGPLPRKFRSSNLMRYITLSAGLIS